MVASDLDCTVGNTAGELAMSTMQAVMLTAPGVVEQVTVPVPGAPLGDEVLIRVTRAGICGSELEGVVTKSPRRKPPLIMGHEFAGVIEAIGPDVDTARWRVGDRVVPNPLMPCGQCRTCQRGRTNACPNRILLGLHRDGGHAELAKCSVRHLHRTPSGISDDDAATAEPLAVAVHGVRLLGEAGVLPRSIVIFGAGTIGLLALQSARLAGATTTVVIDRDPHRLEVASRLGATRVIDARTDDGSTDALGRLALEMTDGEGFDGALDCVGVGATRAGAVRMVAPGGTAVWIGSAADEIPVRGMELVLNEKRVQGAYSYTDHDFSAALGLLAAGRVELTSWSKVYALGEGASLFTRLLTHTEPCIKALLDPRG